MSLPATHIIHKTNHTQYKRICAVNRKHSLGQSITARLKMVDGNNIFSGLKPGIYSIDIDNERYYFDLYVEVPSNSNLYIISPHLAYAIIDNKKYMFNLYKQTVILNSGLIEFVLPGTVNDNLDMIIIDGKTSVYTASHTDFVNTYATIPINGVIPSYEEQEAWSGTLADMLVDNIVWRNLTLSDSNVIDDEYNIDDKPWIVQSISLIGISTSREKQLEYLAIIPINGVIPTSIQQAADTRTLDELEDENVIWSGIALLDGLNYLEILLKNNIKALPDGTKDTFILNAEQQRHHLIYRVGRRVFTGNEPWSVCTEYSNDKCYVLFTPEPNLKDNNSKTNIMCSHFDIDRSSIILNPNKYDCGMCSGDTAEYGRGFYIKVEKEFFPDTTIDKIQWFCALLLEQLKTEHPVVVEYALLTYRYRTVLIDEYHAKTYYPKTFVKLNALYDVSYFYKGLEGDGLSIDEIEDTQDNIGFLAVVPKNGLIPSSVEQIAESNTLIELSKDNIIIENIEVNELS